MWLKPAYKNKKQNFITIRIVNACEIKTLNKKYRKINKITNILSFSYNIIMSKKKIFSGDLIICSEKIFNEAKKQKKNLDAHWAYISIHGALHLQGYTHNTNINFEKMKKKENEILNILGYQTPY
ncbi:rRNA maturation RNase YbeY [Buchnera aphidicola (Thelaxes californica)]|uniref:Endoribonuclease YbeY n=2 Tax=Buchnera aphidicola TaxID=9 RepID=A0A4D6YMK4_9GAMM|nr:rRNA maturation RNase YbeY [Buchnera aphidicola (Thelaxes californica)]